MDANAGKRGTSVIDAEGALSLLQFPTLTAVEVRRGGGGGRVCAIGRLGLTHALRSP